MARLVLASGSAQRQTLLQQLDFSFDVFAPNIDETHWTNEPIDQYVQRMACEKAQAVKLKQPNAIILAADTSLGLDGKIIGKPESKQHAFAIWDSLSGRSHDVWSGVCVVHAAQVLTRVVHTRVTFQQLNLSDMEMYWATGEPLGKAGGYAIQGIAARFIPRIEGDYSNVIGLPLHETYQLLQRVKAVEGI